MGPEKLRFSQAPGETSAAGLRTILGGTKVEGVDGGGGKTRAAAAVQVEKMVAWNRAVIGR